MPKKTTREAGHFYFPGNPANSLIQPERPENKNAGDSRRREWLKPPPQGSPKVIPNIAKENYPRSGAFLFSGKSGEFFNSAGETGK
ncbi:MAG: hypothetical protein AB2L17_14790 [Lentimicrobium sp.]